MRAVATICLLGLAGCSFDLGGFHAGSGGAPAGSESTASSASTANASTSIGASTSTDGSAGSTTSSDASSSSAGGAGGAGGSPVALAPCAGFTDDFQNFPDNWQTQDASKVGGNDKQAQADIGFPHVYAGAWLDGQQYADCYMSIELVGLSGGSAYLNLYQDIAHFIEIYYDGDKVQAAGESADPGGLPHAMAIAFYGSQVYYLYMKAGETTWQPPLAVKGRSSWMDDGADDSLGFGDAGVVNDSATFDDFNVNVVTTADLQ